MSLRRRTGIEFVVIVLVACSGGKDGGVTPPPSVPVGSIVLTPAGPNNLTAGTSLQLAAAIADVNGQSVSRPLTFVTSDEKVLKVSSTGLVESVGPVGSASITARADGVASNTVSFTVLTGPARNITAMSGQSQTGRVVGTVADALTARVTDGYGNPVSDAAVTWTATGGKLTTESTTTDKNGGTSNTLTLSTTAGQFQVTAALSASATATFSIKSVPGPLQSISFPSRIVVVDAGVSAPAPALVGADAYGNVITGIGASYVSRSADVASVSPSGVLQGLTRGESMLVASAVQGLAGSADSCLVVVVAPGGAYLAADLSRFDLAADTLFTVAVLMDMRSSTTKLGSLAARLTWDPTVFVYQSSSSQTVLVNDGAAGTGTLQFAMASAEGLGGRSVLLQVTFRAASTGGRTGSLAVTPGEVTSVGFQDLRASTTGVIMPVIVR